MHKLIIVGIVTAVASALEHPVNQQMVDEIKRLGGSWEPMEVDENPLSQLEVDDVYRLLGSPFIDIEPYNDLPLYE